jgi:hypothetical protein
MALLRNTSVWEYIYSCVDGEDIPFFFLELLDPKMTAQMDDKAVIIVMYPNVRVMQVTQFSLPMAGGPRTRGSGLQARLVFTSSVPREPTEAGTMVSSAPLLQLLLIRKVRMMQERQAN